MPTAIRIETLSKRYRLGEVGTGTLSHDLHRAWARFRGMPDPFEKVGEVNRREQAGGEYAWALRDVSLDVEQGEIVGIIGRNGAGKSTLLKLLSRVTAPTSGSIKTRGRIASLLEVGTGFHPELTGRENIFLNGAILGMSKQEISRELDDIVEFSGCAKYIDTPVKRYSSGMSVRLGFSVAAHLECETLIVDEVLAVGDAEFQSRCIGKMKDIGQTGRTILFVSHNMQSIENLCERCVMLAEGGVHCEGDPSGVIKEYTQANMSGDDSYVAPPSEAPNQILSLEATGEGKTPATQFGITENIGFSIRITADRPVVCGVSLSNAYGTRIASLNSADTANLVITEPGEHRVHCDIKGMRLAVGSYYASCVLQDAKTRMPLDLVRDALQVEVLSGDIYNTGKLPKSDCIVCPACDWSLN